MVQELCNQFPNFWIVFSLFLLQTGLQWIASLFLFLSAGYMSGSGYPFLRLPAPSPIICPWEVYLSDLGRWDSLTSNWYPQVPTVLCSWQALRVSGLRTNTPNIHIVLPDGPSRKPLQTIPVPFPRSSFQYFIFSGSLHSFHKYFHKVDYRDTVPNQTLRYM